MPLRLDTRASDFGERFATFLGQKRETAPDVDDAVRAIINDVRARGDDCLIELTQRFDRHTLSRDSLRIPAEGNCRCGSCLRC